MARKNRTINLPAPYLRRVWLEPERVADAAAYPFCLPFLQKGFDLSFEHPITIIVGENGTGARLLQLTKYGLEPVSVQDTEHYRLMREFWADPQTFIETMLEE